MKILAIGSRMYLRLVDVGDAEALKEKANDLEIAYNANIPYPYTIEHALSFIDLARQKYLKKEAYHMGAYLLDNTFIGMCALDNIENANRKAELGYWIAKSDQGKGYAKEAIELMVGFGLSELGLDKIYAKVLTNNEKSIKLLAKLDFSNEGMDRQELFDHSGFLDVFVFGISKKEHKNNISILVED